MLALMYWSIECCRTTPSTKHWTHTAHVTQHNKTSRLLLYISDCAFFFQRIQEEKKNRIRISTKDVISRHEIFMFFRVAPHSGTLMGVIPLKTFKNRFVSSVQQWCSLNAHSTNGFSTDVSYRFIQFKWGLKWQGGCLPAFTKFIRILNARE